MKDVTEKIQNLNLKLNSESQLDGKVNTIVEIFYAFERFQNNDNNISKLKKKLVSVK